MILVILAGIFFASFHLAMRNTKEQFVINALGNGISSFLILMLIQYLDMSISIDYIQFKWITSSCTIHILALILVILSYKMIALSIAMPITKALAIITTMTLSIIFFSNTINYLNITSTITSILGLSLLYPKSISFNDVLGKIYAIVSGICIGSYFYINKIAILYTNPLVLRFYVCLFETILMLIIVIQTKKIYKLFNKTNIYYSLSSVLHNIGSILLLFALQSLPPFSMIIASQISLLGSVILSNTVFKEKINFMQLIGILFVVVSLLLNGLSV